MTQSVVEKTSVVEKSWRRQTDSPIWWIAFSCGSVILHLLAFWLISSYKLSASQSANGSAVPIEFIEISPQKPPQAKPQAKPQPKPVLPKLSAKPIVPENSQPALNLRAVKPPVITNDEDAIAFNQKIEQKLVEQQRQQELLQQKLAEQQRQQELLQQQKLAEQQRQLETEQQRQLETEQLQREAEQQRQIAEQLRQRQAQQRELEARIRQQEQEQQRILDEKLRQEELKQQRELEAQKQQAEQQRQLKAQQEEEAEKQRRLQAQRQQEQEQRELANRSKLEAEQQRLLATEEQQPQNPADGEKITAPILDRFGQTAKQASINNQQTPDSPVKDNRLEQIPLDQNHLAKLNQSGGILTASWKIETDTFFKDKPDNLAQPLKRINRDIPLPPPQDSNFQPREFLVWLTIDNQGNLLFVKVDEEIPVALRSQYQEYAEKIFNGQKFIPASGNNGTKPELSNLPIRINIQSSSN